ncbi:alanyl-tRNA editing protein [Albimonas sp. CAU 1670]|uniref:alanyl-tRNA editing protein n=1 Tax=Albimonas sp. CAU 1670 TaxID=3032599 RepID=UPI0023DA2600|nr:alanyl-tRNA editing protein [Albimonas sp. CAU 1670]MDF2231343.1 alanyl-tRNA editing protein [Albimonas sp. CAU 1670]
MFEGPARVVAVDAEGGVTLDRPLFYPAGGGQPGDTGVLEAAGREIRVADARKGEGGCVLVLAEGETPPEVGTQVLQRLDEDRRRAHMRMHTALHLLSVVIPLPVTGGQIGAEKGRLDFDMPEAPEDKDALEAKLNALVEANHPVSDEWITDAELEANPGLVKTMAVKPPMGSGQVRLVRIGTPEATVDLQPCGGTHVRFTGEIGPLRIGKIEKKGKRNRRVSLTFA